MNFSIRPSNRHSGNEFLVRDGQENFQRFACIGACAYSCNDQILPSNVIRSCDLIRLWRLCDGVYEQVIQRSVIPFNRWGGPTRKRNVELFFVFIFSLRPFDGSMSSPVISLGSAQTRKSPSSSSWASIISTVQDNPWCLVMASCKSACFWFLSQHEKFKTTHGLKMEWQSWMAFPTTFHARWMFYRDVPTQTKISSQGVSQNYTYRHLPSTHQGFIGAPAFWRVYGDFPTLPSLCLRTNLVCLDWRLFSECLGSWKMWPNTHQDGNAHSPQSFFNHTFLQCQGCMHIIARRKLNWGIGPAMPRHSTLPKVQLPRAKQLRSHRAWYKLRFAELRNWLSKL